VPLKLVMFQVARIPVRARTTYPV